LISSVHKKDWNVIAHIGKTDVKLEFCWLRDEAHRTPWKLEITMGRKRDYLMTPG
jgi:hypothetical protein